VLIVEFSLDLGVVMDKSVKGTFIVCVTVLASAGIVAFGIICFGKSLEKASYTIERGMANCGNNISKGIRNSGNRVSFPSKIQLQVSSESIESVGHNIEKASKNIYNGMIGSMVSFPSEIKLDLRSGGNKGIYVEKKER
jgi:hypothetical protein